MSRAQLTSTDQQNSGGPVSPFVAGKNKIINGDFGISQRGTSFSTPTSGTYTLDRWCQGYNATGSTFTISQQTFTPGTAPVAGYESSSYLQLAVSSAGSSGTFRQLYTHLEDVRLFAGQTVTISFWAKSSNSSPISIYLNQIFGSGGSSTIGNALGAIGLTTSWARCTASITLPSISGKTIGTSSFLECLFDVGGGAGTWSIWGVQLEAGPVATPFTTATGTLQGELAACQRYYQQNRGQGTAYSSNGIGGSMTFPVQMRATPTMSIVNNQLRQTNSGSTTTPSPNFVFGVDATGCTYIYAGSFSTSLSTGSSCSYDFFYIASAEL
jgi:hypothetical protein